VFNKPPVPAFGQVAPAASSSLATPGYTRLEDGTTNQLAAVLLAHQGDGNATPVGGSLLAAAVNLGFNGATYDRLRTLAAQGDLLGTLAAAQPSSTPGAAHPAVNTAAVVTFGAVAGQSHRLTFLEFGIGGTAPSAVVATVTDGTTTYNFDLPAAASITTITTPARRDRVRGRRRAGHHRPDRGRYRPVPGQRRQAHRLSAGPPPHAHGLDHLDSRHPQAVRRPTLFGLRHGGVGGVAGGERGGRQGRGRD